MVEIFGLERPWNKVKDGMTDAQIREFCSFIADIWPVDTDHRQIMPPPTIRDSGRANRCSSKASTTNYEVNARLYDPPKKTIPLLLAANGPKAMRRTGQYAGGLITDPRTWKEHKNEFVSGVQAAGTV